MDATKPLIPAILESHSLGACPCGMNDMINLLKSTKPLFLYNSRNRLVAKVASMRFRKNSHDMNRPLATNLKPQLLRLLWIKSVTLTSGISCPARPCFRENCVLSTLLGKFSSIHIRCAYPSVQIFHSSLMKPQRGHCDLLSIFLEDSSRSR